MKVLWERIVPLLKGEKPGIWITALLLLVVSFFLGKNLGEYNSERKMPADIQGVLNQENLLLAENRGLGFGKDGTPPTGTATTEELAKYDAYYMADTKEKIIGAAGDSTHTGDCHGADRMQKRACRRTRAGGSSAGE